MASAWPPLAAEETRPARVMSVDEWLLLPEDDAGELAIDLDALWTELSRLADA